MTKGGFQKRGMNHKKKSELQLLAALGERKIKSIKNTYALTETEVLALLKLHQSASKNRDENIKDILKKF